MQDSLVKSKWISKIHRCAVSGECNLLLCMVFTLHCSAEELVTCNNVAKCVACMQLYCCSHIIDSLSDLKFSVLPANIMLSNLHLTTNHVCRNRSFLLVHEKDCWCRCRHSTNVFRINWGVSVKTNQDDLHRQTCNDTPGFKLFNFFN